MRMALFSYASSDENIVLACLYLAAADQLKMLKNTFMKTDYAIK